MKRCLVVAIFLVAVPLLSAQTPTKLLTDDGNTFLAQCAQNGEASAPGFCTMYVGGVIDGAQISDKPAFCLPENVSYGQMVRVSIKYMQEHPESLQHPTAALVITAHAKAFPCTSR